MPKSIANDKINLCICANLLMEDNTGGTNRILSLAKNVSKNQVNVFLVSRSPRKSFLIDEGKYNQLKNDVANEKCFPLSIRLIFPGICRVLQEILDRMLRIFTFSTKSEVGLSYVIDPFFFVKLFYVCKKEGVNLIQFEFPAPSFASFILKKLLNIPLIYDAHNIETVRIRNAKNTSSIYATIVKLIENLSCKISESIFVVSEKDKEQLVFLQQPEYKIKVISNSVNFNKLSKSSNGKAIKNKYELEGKLVLIFHGPLDYPPNKEAAWLLANDILPSLSKKYPHIRLLLVGRNPPRIHNSNMIITGFVENLYDYIDAADIALVPLLSGGGTRIKILEYLACGKPVVSTLKGAEGLNLKHGYDILMSKYPDFHFTELVFELIENDNLRKSMSLNAQNTIRSSYDWETTTKKAVQIYKDIHKVQ